MIMTTFDGAPLYLLDISPDWNGPVSATFSILTSEEEGLTAREIRRPLSGTFRIGQTFTILAAGSSARRLENALRTARLERVAVPFWPAQKLFGESETQPLTGGVNLAITQDGATWEIYTSSVPGWVTATDIIVPLVVGRLNDRSLTWLTPDQCSVQIRHTEASPASYALSPPAASFTAGPSPDAAYAVAPRIFPASVNFIEPGHTFAVQVERAEIGFGRVPSESSYPDAPIRGQSTEHFASGRVAIGRLLRFFLDHAGGTAFWLPTWSDVVRLAANVTVSQTVIPVDSSASIEAGDWLSFTSDGGNTTAFAKVASVGSGTMTMATAPGVLVASQTVVSRLMLCRFQRPQLALEFTGVDYADCRLQVREVEPEYTPGAGETLGVTLGRGAQLVTLYEIVSGGTTERLTNHEENVTLSGNTYTAVRLEHGEISRGTQLDRDNVRLRADLDASTLLRSILSLTAAGPVAVTIKEATLSGTTASSPSVLFTGEVSGDVTVKGSVLSAAVAPWGTAFDRRTPRVRLQPGCNNTLFDAGCALLKTDWHFTASMGSVGTPGWPFTFNLTGLARTTGATPTYFADWFAGGWIEVGGDRVPIRASTNPVSGALTVTLARDPVPFPSVAASCVLYPGCDGRRETCLAYNGSTNPKGKFNNYLNFLGHPFMPVSNPSLVKLSTAVNGGKK